MTGVGQALADLADAKLSFGSQQILWREVVGNAFGLASAVGGMRRRLWAWPVGIVGNALLFTVFLGAAFHTPQGADLYGQAGRQVMFAVVSVYGWWRWRAAAHGGGGGHHPDVAVVPRWATWPERGLLAVVALVAVAALTWLFGMLGSFPPVWADAWIFTGSFLASYAMARGWVDFWLVWLGVDAVGVPLLLRAHLYPSAVLYIVYGGFVVWGFTVWLRATREQEVAVPAAAATPEVAR